MIHPIKAVPADQPSIWNELLDEAGPHDFYHTAEYHALAEQRGEGKAVLLAWQGRDGTVVLPLLIRPLDRIPALAKSASGGLCDATSVYGYSGPVGRRLDTDCLTRFTSALTDWFREQSVVCLFSRLHPLLPNAPPVATAGEVVALGPTVAIDLAKPEERQMAEFRSNHRRDLRKLRSRGFACAIESGSDAISTFCRIYNETMARVDATADYLFDENYVSSLLAINGLDLMVCRSDGEACAAAVVSRFGLIAQYHLGGTSGKWLSHAPMKLIFDETRRLASDSGCRWLHLGGGLGAREDALFNFKAGFSADRKTFEVWRWIIDEPGYQELAALAGAQTDTGYFPAYADPALSSR